MDVYNVMLWIIICWLHYFSIEKKTWMLILAIKTLLPWLPPWSFTYPTATGFMGRKVTKLIVCLVPLSKWAFLYSLGGRIDPPIKWTFKKNGYRICSTWSNLSRSHVFLVSIVGATPYHIPLNYRCPIKGRNKYRHIYLSGWDLELVLQIITC